MATKPVTAMVDIPGTGKVEVVMKNAASEETLERITKALGGTTGRPAPGSARARETQATQAATTQINRLSGSVEDMMNTVDGGEQTLADMFDAVDQTSNSMGKFKSTVVNAGAAVADFGRGLVSSVMDLTDDLTSLTPLIDLFTDMATRIGDFISSLADGIPVVSQIVGGMGKLVGVMATLGSAVMGFALGQLESLANAFDNVSHTGAAFSGGMTEMFNDMTQNRVTLSDFATIIRNTSESLVIFGGTLTDGVKKLSMVNGIMVSKFGVPLRNLGIGMAEAAEYTADYLEGRALEDTINRKTAAALADDSMQYILNLKTMSNLTGEDIKTMKAKNRDAARQGAVQARLDELQEQGKMNSVENYKSMSTKFRAYGSEWQKVVDDYFTNGRIMSTQIGKIAMMNPALEKAIEKAAALANSGNQSGANYQKSLESLVRANYAGIESGVKAQRQWAKLGAASDNDFIQLATTMYTPMRDEVITMTKRLSKSVDEIMSTARKAAATDDTATRELNTAKDKMLEAALKVQRATVEHLLPKAAEIAGFAATAALAMVELTTAGVTGFVENLKKMVVSVQSFLDNPKKAMGDVVTDVTDATMKFFRGMFSSLEATINNIFRSGVASGTQSAAEKATTSKTVTKDELITTLKDLQSEYKKMNWFERAFDDLGSAIKGIPSTKDHLLAIKEISDKTKSGMSIQNAQDIVANENNRKKTSDMRKQLAAEQGKLKIFNSNPRMYRDQKTRTEQKIKELEDQLKNQAPQFRFGGISNAPSTGRLTNLHGMEAVVPLPDGKSIPVQMDTESLLTGIKEALLETTKSGKTGGNDSVATLNEIKELMRKQLAATSALVDGMGGMATSAKQQTRVMKDKRTFV